MPHIQAIGFYMVQQWYAVENLVASTISDTRIDLAWSIIQAGMTGITIEYSTDGVTYSYLDFVGGSEVTYSATGLTTNTQYWFRARGVKSGTYSEYCTPADDWTAMKFVVDSFGTGAGRAGCSFKIITEAIRVTIDGNGLFWTNNTGGTSSTTWNIAVGSSTRYVSVSSGSATILIFHKNNVTEWGIGYSGGRASLGWNASAANSPRITLTTSGIVRSLQHIALGIYGASGGVVTGTWASLHTGLISFYINGGSVNITGAPADLPQNLEVFTLISGGALIGDCVGLPSSLKSLYLNSSSSNVSGNVSDLPTSLEYVNIPVGTTITGDVSEVPQTGILYYLSISGSNTLSGDIGGLYYSNCILEFLSISGSNTISGNISGISDMDTLEYINISGNNTLSGDVSGFPQNGVLYSITIGGNNTITGDIAGLNYSGCALTTLYLMGDNTISGMVSDIPSTVTYSYITGNNVISGDIADVAQTGVIQIAGDNTISGDIADIPNDTFTTFNITGENTLTGDVGNLPNLKLTSFTVIGNNTLYGNFEDIPVNITHIDIRGGSGNISGDINNLPSDSAIATILLDHTTLTGDIANFPDTLGYISISGANTLYGDLADVPSSMYRFNLLGNNTVSDYTPPSGGKTWMNLATTNKDFNFQPASGGGLSSTEVDDLIIDLDASASGTYTRIIYITGNNDPRTSASDAAVASLLSKGITVVTNP